MGFNLQSFFESLRYIIDNEEDLDEQDILAELEDCIKESMQYAKECGLIN